jgi:hypothetical protein
MTAIFDRTSCSKGMQKHNTLCFHCGVLLGSRIASDRNNIGVCSECLGDIYQESHRMPIVILDHILFSVLDNSWLDTPSKLSSPDEQW